MKILISCLSKSWGGLEMFSVTSALQLMKRGFDVKMIAYPDSDVYKDCVNKNVEVHKVKAGSYFHPVEILKLAKFIKKNKFDVIHTQYSKDLWTLVPALQFAGSNCPLFLTKQMGSFIVKKDFLHKALYNRVNNVFAISNIIKTNLLDTCPLTPDKIKLLHNGVDTANYAPQFFDGKPVRKEFNVSDNELAIGMLARLSPGKGHEEFLFSAKKLIAENKNLKFLVIGGASAGEDEYAGKIKSAAAEMGIADNVIFTGFRKDIPNLLSALDIFVFPSHSEAFGIALVEAMSMAKPCVGTKSDGVLDIIVDSETGYFFEKNNVDELTEKIGLLINSKEKRIDFGNKARERAVSKFDIEVLTDKVIKYYKEVIQINDVS